MIFHLLGSLLLGICAAALLMLCFRVSGRRAPRWLLPASAGAAMFGFHVWSDYTWFRRTAAALPSPMTVAAASTSGTTMQPWTYLLPRVERFAAIDPRAIRWNERVPGLRLTEVHLVARYMPTLTTMQFFDCAASRRADAPRTLVLDAEGRPAGLDWVRLESGDALLRAVCSAPLPLQPSAAPGMPDNGTPPGRS
ncbi:hypothetical protein [Sabulicella glaciei]|uniref:Uncharacterized protein n=1 Tax=Sabulicella glaciei TaxID=2984948 RepID=A0ABT3NU77_9PROT|nr:hypothetical protein [Roseococcus sp. MDT2-1-1]MCW8085723.1 hypothetical protein [Roseococcus sp. MDT2-1-1]